MTKSTEQPAMFSGTLTKEDLEVIKQAKSVAGYRAHEFVSNAWDQLSEQLRQAGEQFSTNRSANGGRRGVALALVAVLGFFEEVRPQIVKQQLDSPLVALLDSLGALEKGIVTALLVPRRKSGRPPADGGYNLIKAASVFTVHRLVATGMERPAARSTVAKLLACMGVRPARKGASASTPITARTIRKWEDDIGINTEATLAFRQLEHEYAASSAGSGVEEDGLRATMAFVDELKLGILQDELSPSEAAKEVRRQHLKSLEATVSLAREPTKTT